MPSPYEIDPASPLLFVINGASGASEASAKRDAIQDALDSAGRRGDLIFCKPAEIEGAAKDAAVRAIATRTALQRSVATAPSVLWRKQRMRPAARWA